MFYIKRNKNHFLQMVVRKRHEDVVKILIRKGGLLKN